MIRTWNLSARTATSTPAGIGNQFQYFFNAARGSQDCDPQRCTRSVTPGVRNFLTKSYDIARSTLEYFVAVCDTRSPFQNCDMFILSFVEMQRRSITGAGHNFDQRIQAVRVLGRHADQATFTGSRF